MGERKVLNKYYPPDFDPAKIPRRKRPKNEQMKVRMMLPMSIRCNTCGNYIYKGTKFNSRKEDVEEETYLGIQIFRFYFKCTRCSAELAMKTDPQNSDYTMESGATRNYEPWREKDEALDAAKKKQEMEEMGDAMKALENRTIDSKQEMDILAALDEMKSMRSRQAGINTDDMLSALRQTAAEREQELADEDERTIRSIVFQNSDGFVKRVEDDDEQEDELDGTAHRENAAGSSGRRLLGMAAEDFKFSKKRRLDSGGVERIEDGKAVPSTSENRAHAVDPLVSHAQAEPTEGALKTSRKEVAAGSKKLPPPSFAVQFKRPTIQLKPKVEVKKEVGVLASLAAYASDESDE